MIIGTISERSTESFNGITLRSVREHQDRRAREVQWLRQGERVRQARESVGFKHQEPFAEALGVDRQSVSNWERGRQRVTESRAAQIEHLCNADAGFILTGDGYLWGGEPRLNPPSANEIDLLRRVADLEFEVLALRSALLTIPGLEATADDIRAAANSARKAAAQAGRAAQTEEPQQG